MSLRALASAATLVCAACGSDHVIAQRDPLVLYGDEPVPLPLSLVRGTDTLAAPQVTRLRLSTDSAVAPADGRVRCHRAGQGEVTVWAAGDSVSLTVVCRPARRFTTDPFPLLRVGTAPTPLIVIAELQSGGIDTVRPLSYRVRDTLAVRIQEGRMVPVRAGRSRVEIDVGGHLVLIRAAVQEIVVAETLSLAAGESRAWPLDSGLFEIRVAAVGPSGGMEWPVMETDGARCAPVSNDGNTINCAVRDRAVITLRRERMVSTERARPVVLSVTRVPR